MNREKLMYLLDHPEDLPERGYVTLPSDDREVIIVKKGERGYYPFERYSAAHNARETCDLMNSTYKCTDEEAAALMILSMRS